MENHIHPGETGGGHIHLLSLKRDALAGLGGDFEQE
jgi:hypothetical protein